MHRGYRLLDHTADALVEIRGRDLREVYDNSARAVFELVFGRARVSPTESRMLTLTAGSPSELLLEFLRELLYLVNVHGFATTHVDVSDCKATNLRITLVGGACSRRPQLEIKAPTYSGLRLEHYRRGWRAVILFDI